MVTFQRQMKKPNRFHANAKCTNTAMDVRTRKGLQTLKTLFMVLSAKLLEVTAYGMSRLTGDFLMIQQIVTFAYIGLRQEASPRPLFLPSHVTKVGWTIYTGEPSIAGPVIIRGSMKCDLLKSILQD